MRDKLAADEEKRKKFSAVFVRTGRKTSFKGYTEETILLRHVVDMETNQVVADHVWLNYTKGFEKVSLTSGSMIEFEARIKIYKKGYVNRRYGIDHTKSDFKLSHPTQIRKVDKRRI